MTTSVKASSINNYDIGYLDRLNTLFKKRKQQKIFDRFKARQNTGLDYCPGAWHEIKEGNSQLMFFGYDRGFFEIEFQNQTYETLKERLSRGRIEDRAYAILPMDEEGVILTRLARETERVHILRSRSNIKRGFSILSPFYVLTFDPICELAPLITSDATVQRTVMMGLDLVLHYEGIFERERAKIVFSPDFSYES